MRARVAAKKPPGPSAGPDNSGPAVSSSRVQSVDRAVWLLRAVADAGPAGSPTAALGEACGLNRATAWRILTTLESHGLVVSDRASGRWSLGPGLVDIARTAGSEVVLRDVHAVLDRLAHQTGETAALAVVRQGALTYVEEVAPAAIVSTSWSGQWVSLHATSTGKVLLAWSTEEELARLLPRRLKRFTVHDDHRSCRPVRGPRPNPRTGLRHLLRRVRRVRLGRVGTRARPHGSSSWRC